MSCSRLTTALVFRVVLFLVLVIGCLAVGEKIEDVGASDSPLTPEYYRLGASSMGKHQTIHYTKLLNSRLKELNLPSSPLAQATVPTPEVNDYLEAVHRQLNTDSHLPSLLHIGQTPDKRRVHALFLKNIDASPNIAFLSTPKIWHSLDQNVQLHTFAKVDTLDGPDLHAAFKGDFNYNSLNSLARNALPKTPELEFGKLIGRMPH